MVLLPQSISTRKAVLQYVPGKGYYLPNGKYLGNFFPMFEVKNLQASFIYAKKGEWPTLDNARAIVDRDENRAMQITKKD
jgi:hypothetical protein